MMIMTLLLDSSLLGSVLAKQHTILRIKLNKFLEKDIYASQHLIFSLCVLAFFIFNVSQFPIYYIWANYFPNCNTKFEIVAVLELITRNYITMVYKTLLAKMSASISLVILSLQAIRESFFQMEAEMREMTENPKLGVDHKKL